MIYVDSLQHYGEQSSDLATLPHSPHGDDSFDCGYYNYVRTGPPYSCESLDRTIEGSTVSTKNAHVRFVIVLKYQRQNELHLYDLFFPWILSF